jgi:hypothetical protein
MYYDFGDTGSGAGDAGPGLSGWLGADDFGPGAGGTMYTSQPVIFSVQEALNIRGYGIYKNGQFDNATEAALAAFNAKRGVTRRGPPDLDTLHALGLDYDGSSWSPGGPTASDLMNPLSSFYQAPLGVNTGLPVPGGSPAPNIPGAPPSIITGAQAPAAQPAHRPIPFVDFTPPPNGPAPAKAGGGIIASIQSFFAGLSPLQLGAAAAAALLLGGELLSGPAPRRRALPRRRRR